MDRLSRAKQVEFYNATHCHICPKPFEGDQDLIELIVRDHDHVTGWFFAAAHQQCNLQQFANIQISVFFHNFRGYDSHIIVHEFTNIQEHELKVIKQNMKKYLKVKWSPNIVFRDSLQFLTSFYDYLVKSLAKTGWQNFFLLHG